MLIAGAKGHAKEVLDILPDELLAGLCFFDNVSTDLPELLFGRFRVLRTEEQVQAHFTQHPDFVLGTGNPLHRQALCLLMEKLGGKLCSATAQTAIVSKHNAQLADGLNLMHQVFVSANVRIGKGSLLNARAAVHHDCVIGDFCEISPKAVLTGNVQIGDFTTIGSGAILLPKVKVGRNCVIGAGAVVNKNLPDNSVAVGVPAKVVRQNTPLAFVP